MGVLGADSRRTLIHPASQSSGLRMTFWQENYAFIKDVYDMRHQKMAEWMENVEKAIARIMADKVYTSAEFKRERDNFHALCKDLERAEVKKWLAQILEILMAERAKDLRAKEHALLEDLIKKHEELIPTVQKTTVMVDLYWKCYAYGDELKSLSDQVNTFDKTCLQYMKVLEAAEAASKKMTTHAEADTEVAALKARYTKVKAVSDEWVKKVETLLKEWVLLDNTVTELNSWVAKDKTTEGENQFSLEKMESTLGELKNIFKEKEK